jgi:hypothetical protein
MLKSDMSRILHIRADGDVKIQHETTWYNEASWTRGTEATFEVVPLLGCAILQAFVRQKLHFHKETTVTHQWPLCKGDMI